MSLMKIWTISKSGLSLINQAVHQKQNSALWALFCYTKRPMGWRFRRVRRRSSSVTKHYLTHKKRARELVHLKLAQWNMVYGFSYNRVAIRNTRRSWGSCTSLKNLNFSYKVLFLPEHLQDYIIVHELCHLQELNHGSGFWQLVERGIPNHKECRKELRTLEKKHSFIRAVPLLYGIRENQVL